MNLDKAASLMLYIFGVFFNIALLVVLGYAIHYFAIYGFNLGGEFAQDMVATGPDEQVIFVLEEDTPAAEVARRLETLGIIQNRWVFQLELFLKNSTRVYRAGTYTLNRSMTNTEVNVALRTQNAAAAPHLVVRVVEGWSMRDMAQYFEYREFFSQEDFFYVAEHGHFSFPFLFDLPDRPYRLEGYLFPDTYWVSLNPTPGEIITAMLRRFDDIFGEPLHTRAEEMGLSVDEVVIMASIIEAETRIAGERGTISQIIHSRLAAGMNLQMRSTVAYVQNIRRDLLTETDLQVASPHNTFTNAGLPQGPISSPSEASLLAALYPADTAYLYFFLTDIQTGQHRFFNTQADMQAALAQGVQ